MTHLVMYMLIEYSQAVLNVLSNIDDLCKGLIKKNLNSHLKSLMTTINCLGLYSHQLRSSLLIIYRVRASNEYILQ